MKRGATPAEWDDLPLRDREAVAWWQYVESSGYTAPSEDDIKKVPVKGGARGRLYMAIEKARASFYPPDEPED